MTKRIIYFALVSLLLFQSCNDSDKMKNDNLYSENILFDKPITDILYETIKYYPNQTEFSIALIVGDTTEYFGLRKSNSEIIQISNNESIFEIGSISKVFLTSLLVQAMNDSLITLNDKLRDLLPFKLSSYGYHEHEVKIIHLANHTSGIEALPEGIIKDYQFNEKDDDELEKVKKYLSKKTKFKWQAGLKYEYSNLGMALLGQIISKLYNTSYNSLVKKFICEPFGMQNTTVKLDSIQKNKLVQGIDQFGNNAPMLISELYSSSGGLKSNVIDMVKFIKNNMEEDYIYKYAHETTFKIDEVYSVALGWSYSNRHNSRVYYHHGGTVGYSTGIAFDKQNKIGIVLLTNRSALLYSAPDITNFMYRVFGDTFYKYRVKDT